jgi:von Willebrand factor A domain-containing protein 7
MTPKWALNQAAGRVALAAIVCGCIAGTGAEQLPQVNRSHSFGPDQCGPADPSYIKMANETGGVPLFLQRSEAGKAMQLMVESTRENVSTVLWASAKLVGVGQEFEIPVDSVTERITFTFSVDTKGMKLALREPNGREVSIGSPGAQDTELNCGRIVTVVKPQAGRWRAEVSGSGTFWLEAKAQSAIYFIKAEFVEVGGRPGHKGMFRIQGQPIARKPARLQVSMSAGDARTTEFALVSAKGDVIERLHLHATSDDRDFLDLAGEVELPAVPFRVAVTGRDEREMPYQRFYAPLFHAENVQVVPKFGFDEIAPGEKKTGEFEVRNFGPARSFKVTVTDAHRFVTKVEPQELTLGANGIGKLHVQLAAPADTQRGVGDDVIVVVASTSGTPTTNSATVHLSVGGNSGAADGHQ